MGGIQNSQNRRGAGWLRDDLEASRRHVMMVVDENESLLLLSSIWINRTVSVVGLAFGATTLMSH